MDKNCAPMDKNCAPMDKNCAPMEVLATQDLMSDKYITVVVGWVGWIGVGVVGWVVLGW